MNLLVLSDIHGNSKALDKVLSLNLEYQCLLIVGDSLYHGPRNPILEGYDPQKVSVILNSIKVPIIAVRGNCDAEVDQMLLEFPMMQDYTTTNLNNLLITMSHGHLFDPYDHAILSKCDLYITGHTHLPILKQNQGFIMFNPGSISLPKENNPPTFGYITESTIEIRTLDNKTFKSITY